MSSEAKCLVPSIGSTLISGPKSRDLCFGLGANILRRLVALALVRELVADAIGDDILDISISTIYWSQKYFEDPSDLSKEEPYVRG